MNKNTISLIVAVIIVAVVAVLFATDVINLPEKGGDTPDETTEESVVAVVNGEEIQRAELDTRFAQTEQNLVAQGQGAQLQDETVRAQLETQILDQLIAETLVAQQAEEENISVTAAEVDEQIQTLTTQAGSEEAFATQLTQAGLTEAELRANIQDQLLTQKYLESVIDLESVEVTDEEVQAAYDEIAASQENVPALDDQIREQLRAQLLQQEQGALVAEHVAELRGEAEIEILI